MIWLMLTLIGIIINIDRPKAISLNDKVFMISVGLYRLKISNAQDIGMRNAKVMCPVVVSKNCSKKIAHTTSNR